MSGTAQCFRFFFKLFVVEPNKKQQRKKEKGTSQETMQTALY